MRNVAYQHSVFDESSFPWSNKSNWTDSELALPPSYVLPSFDEISEVDREIYGLDKETYEYEIAESVKPVKPSVAPSEPFQPTTFTEVERGH